MNPPRAPRILVVDDADYNRDVMARILERDGYVVDTSVDGRDAMVKLKERDYDMVLLDVMMPEMDGIEVMTAIRQDEVLRHIPVVMLSALNEQEGIVKCIQLGAQDYLPKPINQQLLKARITSCLERKQLRDSEAKYIQQVEAISAQLKDANHDLRRMNRLKSRFLATAAHDLKNPLGGIMLVSDRIRVTAEERGPHEAISAQAGRIHDSVRRMLDIINNLLDTAAQELNEVPVSFELRNIADVVHEVVNSNQPYAGSKDIRLRYLETMGAECWGEVDGVRLRQAMDNLVNNAIKYSPHNKEVVVDLSLRVVNGEDRVHIEVRDQGPGLSAEDKQRAFGLFQRLSAQPTGGEYSTGLGLSIVKQMVELHQGWISIESEPGNGAAFIVELPLRKGDSNLI